VRVLMLTQFYAPIVGGEERMVEAMATGLAARGHDVAVATLQPGDEPAHEVRDGVAIHRLPSTATRVRALRTDRARPHALPVPDPVTVRALRPLLHRWRPHVVHAHNWIVASYLPLRRAAGAPLVLSLHDHSTICATKRLVRRDAPCSGPGPAKCTACSAEHFGRIAGPAVAAGLWSVRPALRAAVSLALPVSRAVAERAQLGRHGRPWEVLPNFVPDDLAARAGSPPPGLPPDGFIMLAGDLTHDKGVGVLLDAHAALPGAPPLVLMGRPLDPRLRDAGPRVVVLGPRPHGEVLAAWRASAIAAVPSVTPEAFGLVALEAMSFGRPVVASAHGGLLDLVDDGASGLLVAPGDAGALRAALARLAGDAQLRRRLGDEARRRAQRLTASAVLPRLERAYARVLTPAGASSAGAERPQRRAA
jgi:glycosyltransferase involved in cell wall biosynthesis